MHQHDRKPDQTAVRRHAQEQGVAAQTVHPVESLQRTVGNRATERLLRAGAIPGTRSTSQVQRQGSPIVEQHGLQGVSRQGGGLGHLAGRLMQWVEDSGGVSGVAEGVGESASEGVGELGSLLQGGGGIGGIISRVIRRVLGEQSPEEENQ